MIVVFRLCFLVGYLTLFGRVQFSKAVIVPESKAPHSHWSTNMASKMKDIYIPPRNVTENKPRIFLRRMRKAGSSTVSEFVFSAAQTYASVKGKNIEDVIIYDRMEYPGLNVKCIFGPNPILMLPKTILITHFRNPLSRINSEYW
jgi:hypothetical protein